MAPCANYPFITTYACSGCIHKRYEVFIGHCAPKIAISRYLYSTGRQRRADISVRRDHPKLTASKQRKEQEGEKGKERDLLEGELHVGLLVN